MSAWKTSTLADIASFARDIIEPHKILTGSVYVGLENIESGGRFLNVKSVVNGELASSKFVFTDRHLLYGKLRPYLAKIACPEFEGVCSTDILPILPGPNADRKYLAYFLRQPDMVELASSRSAGANLPRLSPKVLGEFEIPLPPLPEQQRIAAILDAADALREKRRQAIAKLDALVQAVFVEMFGNFNPRRYQLEPLGACAHVVSGVTKGRQLNGRPTVELPYLRVANVQAGRLDLSEIKTITALPSDLDALRLQKGDVLLTEGGDYDKLGRGARWRGEIENCIHQNHIFRVRVDQEKLVPEFFEAYLQTPFTREYFLRCAKKTTNLASINSTQLRALPIHIPPIAIQERFRSVLYRIELLNEVAISSLAHLNTLFLSLQQRAFRGEL